MNSGLKPGIILLNVLLGLLATGLLLLAAVSGNAQANSAAETSTPTEFLNTLSAQERAWLRDHPVIRVAQDPGWPPIEFADERGTPSGMTADYLRLVEGRLGVKFQQVKNLSWQEAYARMKRWEIDITPSVAVTAERETFWAFTKPYMTIPLVIVTRSDATYIADLRELEGKKVVVVAGYVAETWIARDFPEIQLVRAQTTQEALAMLQSGEVFACVDNMLVVDHVITNSKMSGLKISGSTPYNNAQSMAVRKDWAILAGILDKALDSISATERNTIFRKWLPIQYQSAFDYTRLWPVAAILALVLMGLVTWNWKLAAEIRRRKQSEEALRESEETFRTMVDSLPLAIHLTTGLDQVSEYLNPTMVKLFGYTREDIPSVAQWWPLAYPDVEYRRQISEEWNRRVERSIAAQTPIEPMEVVVTCKDGSRKNISWGFLTMGAKNYAFGLDLTERKQLETERQKFFLLAESSNDFIGMCDLDMQTLYVNPAGRRMVGLPDMAAACRLKVPDYLYPEDQRFIGEELFPRVLREGHGDVEIRLRHFQTGEPIWMFYYLFSVHDASGTPIGWATVARDMTERRQAEEALRQSRRAALNIMTDAVEARDRAEQAEEKITEQLQELQRFNDVTIGREWNMIDLKKEVNALLKQSGQEEKYPIVE